MTEHVVAVGLAVTCEDGTMHSDVTLTVRDGKRVYEAPDGRKLCVCKTNGGAFLVSPMVATMIICNCPMEVDE